MSVPVARRSTNATANALSDLEQPTDIGWQALGPALTLSTVALALVCLRWFTRLIIVRKVGLDDWLISGSMILSIGMTVGIAIQSFQRKQVSVGRNDWGGFDVAIAPTVAKLVLVNNVLYSTVTNLTKASVVVQYLRLFYSPTIRAICYCLLVLLVGAALYGIFAGVFICQPASRFWDATAEGHCFDADVLWLAGAGINIPLDWAVWVTPMPVISKLRLPRRQMIGVCMVFALGGFVCVTSITRLVVVHVASVHGEHSKAGVRSVQWSAIEADVGIICASLMALKPLVLRVAPRLLTDTQSSRLTMPIMPLCVDDTAGSQFWQGSSISTTCVGSEDTSVSTPRPEDQIKVTTEMQQTVSGESSGVWARMSGLWAYKPR